MARAAFAAVASLFAGGATASFDTVAMMQMQSGALSADIDVDIDQGDLPPNKRMLHTTPDPMSLPYDKRDKDHMWVKPAYTIHPREQEVYVGALHCDLIDMGVRMTVRDWPNDIRVYVFPTPHLDIGTGRWCPPIHQCTGGFDAHATIDEDVVNITPNLGGRGNTTEKCGWPEFSLVGSWFDEPEGLHGQGSLFQWDGPNEMPWFISHHSDDYASRYSVHCKQIHHAIMSAQWSGGVTCKKFDLMKCQGRPVKKGEKILYFMKSFAGDGPNEADPQLKPRDRKWALSQKDHPLFRKAFGDEDDRRADIIYVAPTVRALESAGLAFGTEGVPFKIDWRLKDRNNKALKSNYVRKMTELVDTGYLDRSSGDSMMRAYDDWQNSTKGQNENDLLGDNDNRVETFLHDLLERPEKHIVIVAHNNILDHAGGFGDFPGGVEARILDENGVISNFKNDPNCWGQL